MSEQKQNRELIVGKLAEEPETTLIDEQISAPPRFRLLHRAGCFVLLVIWFAILLLPCFFIVLASQQQIVISQGSLPGQELRVWLIMEPQQRGIGISRTSLHEPVDPPADETLCLQTDVSYLLWQGKAEDPISYCECYIRSGENEAWIPLSTEAGTCPT